MRRRTNLRASASTAATPLQIKAALDDALLKAKVDFLYGCFPSDVLTNADGSICGIVMANRAGRQAVRAKVIIDATPDVGILINLGEFYAQRTLLKREVLPEHVAAAVFVLTAGDLSLTTGLHIPVDAGVAAAFLR